MAVPGEGNLGRAQVGQILPVASAVAHLWSPGATWWQRGQLLRCRSARLTGGGAGVRRGWCFSWGCCSSGTRAAGPAPHCPLWCTDQLGPEWSSWASEQGRGSGGSPRVGPDCRFRVPQRLGRQEIEDPIPAPGSVAWATSLPSQCHFPQAGIRGRPGGSRLAFDPGARVPGLQCGNRGESHGHQGQRQRPAPGRAVQGWGRVPHMRPPPRQGLEKLPPGSFFLIPD